MPSWRRSAPEMPGFARLLAADLVKTGARGLSEDLMHAACLHSCDTIIAAMAGARVGMVGKVANALGYAGDPEEMPPSRRALGLALAAHVLQSDDGDLAAGTHPGCVIVSAAWATKAQATPARDFATAVYLGYRAAALIAAAMPASQMKGSWHRTPVCCSFGAAIGAAWLSGIRTEDGLHNVLCICASLASGILPSYQPVGSMEALHPAIAAEAGVRASRLAAAGVAANGTALDGPNGYLAALCDPVTRVPDVADRGLETAYIKRYPCVRAAHEAIDALLEADSDVLRIELSLANAAMRFVGEFPGSAADAALNIAYCLAVVLHNGRRAPVPSDFGDEMRHRVRDSGLFGRIDIRRSETAASTMRIIGPAGSRIVDLQKRLPSGKDAIERKWMGLVAHGGAPKLSLWKVGDSRSLAGCKTFLERFLQCSLAGMIPCQSR